MSRTPIVRMRGFSMIEVLIAVLILAIGLLGVAALQMASMNSGQESYFRTQATAIAEDYASRIKVGRDAMLKQRDGTGVLLWDTLGAVQTAQAYAANYVADPLACAVPPAKWCRPDATDAPTAEICNVAEQRAFEQWDICRQAANLLPDGTVHVTQAPNSMRLSIAVAWAATAARDDLPEEQTPINPICVANFGIAADKDCIVVEVVP